MKSKINLCLAGLCLSASFAISAFAHADTFVFTPTGGPAYTFTLNPPAPSSVNPNVYSQFFPVTITGAGTIPTTTATVTFYNPATFIGLGDGAIDFFISDPANGFSNIYTGLKLYSGSEASPTFSGGTFTLGAGAFGTSTATGTLVITPAIPEPSSLLLLGTGILGLAGAARRRFLNA